MESVNDQKMQWILHDVFQIARLKAHGCTLNTDGTLMLHSKSDIEVQIKYFQDRIEDEAMGILLRYDPMSTIDNNNFISI